MSAKANDVTTPDPFAALVRELATAPVIDFASKMASEIVDEAWRDLSRQVDEMDTELRRLQPPGAYRAMLASIEAALDQYEDAWERAGRLRDRVEAVRESLAPAPSAAA